QSVLLHRQPDGVWRIDFQLGWDADPEAEKKPERIRPRVDAMMRAALGRDVPFELEWASVYTFSCLRMERFRPGRRLFPGRPAPEHAFARRIVNSGRLAVPATLRRSPLNPPDRDGDDFAGAMVPGAAAVDAPLADGGWLLRRLRGNGFAALAFDAPPEPLAAG